MICRIGSPNAKVFPEPCSTHHIALQMGAAITAMLRPEALLFCNPLVDTWMELEHPTAFRPAEPSHVLMHAVVYLLAPGDICFQQYQGACRLWLATNDGISRSERHGR